MIAIAAVSVRIMRGPNLIDLKPFELVSRYSGSLNPPSGPMSKVRLLSTAVIELIDVEARGFRISRISCSFPLLSIHSCSPTGALILGTTLRPHCSQALIAMRRQWISRFFARLNSSLTTE